MNESKKISGHKRNILNAILTVISTQKISKNFLRIVFSCDKKIIINPLWIGPHLKLIFPKSHNHPIEFPQINEDKKIIWKDGLRERVRTYSIRFYDEKTNQITVDFVIHDSGTGINWTKKAQKGDQIGLVSFGSKNTLNDSSPLFLIGDITTLPGISYTLEHISKEQETIAIVEVNDESDKLPITLPSNAKIHWLVHQENQPSQLVNRINDVDLTLQGENGLIWGGMESTLSRTVRSCLKEKFANLSSNMIQIISYWREGFAEGEFKHHD